MTLLLADHFLRRHCARYRRGPMRFSASARRVLAALSHVLEQAVLLASSEVLEPANLLLSAQIPIAGQSAAFVLPEEGADLESVEQNLVRQALERTGWNVTAAAKLLGPTRDTLRYRIDKHRLRQSSEL